MRYILFSYDGKVNLFIRPGITWISQLFMVKELSDETWFFILQKLDLISNFYTT